MAITYTNTKRHALFAASGKVNNSCFVHCKVTDNLHKYKGIKITTKEQRIKSSIDLSVSHRKANLPR